jgi:hypothetical protein
MGLVHVGWSAGSFSFPYFYWCRQKGFEFPGNGHRFSAYAGHTHLGWAAHFLGWKILLSAYPQYNDLLNGFTYNGHDYIGAFVFLALAVCFLLYLKPRNEIAAANHSVAPLLLWIIVNLAIAAYLPGAGFFIIPVFLAC